MSLPTPGPFSRCAPEVVLAHPLGNQFFKHLGLALQREGRLKEICTCIDWNNQGLLDRLLPAGVRAEVGRRAFSRNMGVPAASHPWREVGRLVSGRFGWSRLIRHEAGMFSVDAIYQDFDRWVARRLEKTAGIGTIYAYEDAAKVSFEVAARRGWTRVYDLPIAYWETSRRILEEEAARLPAWEPTLIGTRDSAEKLARKTHELSLAQIVVCPSRFTADSLPAEAHGRCRVIVAPFGSPPSGPPREPGATGAPLRVLFAGSMSQRKGLADLFAAVRLLNRRDVELVILGSPVASMSFYRRELADFIYEPPRSHAAVLALMGTCDVLCLPSLVEGRALVIQEAMSQGLPVIITPNTGADDVVTEGVSGFVVPIRSPEAIAEKIGWFADHRDRWAAMSRAAQAAATSFTWDNYAATVISGLEKLDDARTQASPPSGDPSMSSP